MIFHIPKRFFLRGFILEQETASIALSGPKIIADNPSFMSAIADALAKGSFFPLLGSQNFPSTEASAGSNINWLGHYVRMFESARETLTRLAGNFFSIA